MRTVLFLFAFAAIAFISSAQDKNLTGTWNIIECAYITDSGTEKAMDEQIKSGTAVTEYIFHEDGRYTLRSNMAGSGTMDTFEGSWTTSDNKLIMSLKLNDQMMSIEWLYKLNGEVLVLSRSNPEGTFTIANSFRKKQNM